MFGRIAFLVLLAGALVCSTADARGGFGLGVIAGEPTGLSCKLWLGGGMAVDGAAAWSFGNQGALHLHADYLLHSLLNAEGGKLQLYYGIGGRIKLEESQLPPPDGH